MNRFRAIAVAVVTTVAFGSFAAVAAPSATAKAHAPCASEHAQVTKASAKLDALKAKYAAHPTKKNKKAKKAQAQRVRHATARLNTCLAAQPAA